MLAASAIVFLGFRLLLGLGGEDTDLYESPLMLSVARQLVTGPGELYGPFGGNNPLVLIHAPLYYFAGGRAGGMADGGSPGFTRSRRRGSRADHCRPWVCWRRWWRPTDWLGWGAVRGARGGGPCC